MDPISTLRFGQIRQQELIEQAQHWRSAEPFWKRLQRWLDPVIAARRQKARYASADQPFDPCATPSNAVPENC